jgi:hypothetical protein
MFVTLWAWNTIPKQAFDDVMPNMLAVIMMPKNNFILNEFQGKKNTHPSMLVFSLFYSAAIHVEMWNINLISWRI